MGTENRRGERRKHHRWWKVDVKKEREVTSLPKFLRTTFRRLKKSPEGTRQPEKKVKKSHCRYMECRNRRPKGKRGEKGEEGLYNH